MRFCPICQTEPEGKLWWHLVDEHGFNPPGASFAEVYGTRCSHCFFFIKPRYRVAIKRGSIVFCNCGRMLTRIVKC